MNEQHHVHYGAINELFEFNK